MFVLANNTIISHITSFVFVLIKLIDFTVFTKHKNLVVEILSLAKDNYVIIDNSFIT